MKEEIENWNTRYINVDDLVKQNSLLQRDIDNYIDQVKTLMDRINVMEKSGTKEEESNDKIESDDVKETKNLFKSKNKITISVSDAQTYNNNNNNNNVTSSNNVLNAELNKKRKMKKVTRIDLNNRSSDLMTADCFEDFEAINRLGEYRERPAPATALSRCKSFLGFKTKNNLEEGEYLEERSRSAEDNFILKTDCGLVKHHGNNKVKRSKSMDIFKRGIFNHQGKKDLPVVTKSYSHYCKNKIDYVKKWQKDSMQYDLSNQQQQQQPPLKSKYILNKNKSFYSLYF